MRPNLYQNPSHQRTQIYMYHDLPQHAHKLLSCRVETSNYDPTTICEKTAVGGNRLLKLEMWYTFSLAVRKTPLQVLAEGEADLVDVKPWLTWQKYTSAILIMSTDIKRQDWCYVFATRHCPTKVLTRMKVTSPIAPWTLQNPESWKREETNKDARPQPAPPPAWHKPRLHANHTRTQNRKSADQSQSGADMLENNLVMKTY